MIVYLWLRYKRNGILIIIIETTEKDVVDGLSMYTEFLVFVRNAYEP